MIPLVDMMTCEFLDDIVDIGMSYDSFTFPCDAMLVHDAHVDLYICDDIAMPCYEKFDLVSIVACNMLKNCSFPCIASNDVDDDAMIPLVDMMTSDFWDDIVDLGMSYDAFSFPCDTMLDIHDAHVDLAICNDIAMPCYDKFKFAPIVACNMRNNCSFPCVACNDDDNEACYVVTNLKNNCSFPMFVDNNDKTLNMFCTRCLQYSSILASKIMNDN